MTPKRQQKRIYAFVDSQNLNVSTQKFGWKVDWRKFRKFLKEKYGVTHAYLFIGYVPEFRNMYEFLHDAGYGIVLKPTLEMMRDPDEKRPKKDDEKKQATKGNVDADLVLRAMIEYPNYDKAVLVTGDGDFFTLIEYLLKQGKLAKVLAPNIHYSTLYKPFEEHVEQLGKYRNQLAYRDRKKPSSDK
jgi:uncharacterized LabA/DUF88 family protein